MKAKKLSLGIILTVLSFTISCKDTAGEKLEERIEEKAETLENRSDDLEDASEYVKEGFEDIEDAIENFKIALEQVDNAEDRQAIRKRINEIMDELEMNKN